VIQYTGFRKSRGMRAYTVQLHGLLEKVGSQEIPGVTGKFDLGVQNETGQTKANSFAKRMHWS